MAYCQHCQQHFLDIKSLEQHLRSSKHCCDRCQKFFKSPRSKKQHMENSKCQSVHLVGRSCHPNVRSKGPQRARQGRSDSSLPMMIGVAVTDIYPAYLGVPRDAVMPIFRMACRLRFIKPDVDTLLRHINTQLDHMIVAALIEAALRLLPPDNTPEGKERMQKKMRDAQLAENSFTDQIRAMDYRFLTESEQKERNLQPTPDIRFLKPVSIHGKLCHWLEYKNYFGFKANPFVAAKTRKQLRRYLSALGPGAVVYRLGFEIDHISIEGVQSFREAETLYSLKQQSRAKLSMK
ncbi:hypothetical protein BDV37DRAFT_246188 [Aspergillus pseudonomiae]|uniref:CDAN1-interacting nuclease 1 n=1 Tax=Aspergillus pseudonomiae TaxID=1506151 RepID=A0A5N7DEX9_9EURO|nr:uncharacterized protein BDV37DRAFT_246188 [Aspergillus pseudonomiae]KAE8404960.1 hypothetical protein BDV37DRAFT_246188 [Aspergillus pseudonomiae]